MLFTFMYDILHYLPVGREKRLLLGSKDLLPKDRWD